MNKLLHSKYGMTEWPSYNSVEVETVNIPQAVIKISNISWDLRKKDVQEFIGIVCPIDSEWIHFPIDIESGKTRAEMYVEIPTTVQAYSCQEYLTNKLLKGRLVIVSLSCFDDLLVSMFPRDMRQSLLSEDDVNQILNICTNYKTHFSRKCPERPIEYAQSISRLIPWYKTSNETMKAVVNLRQRLSALKHEN